MRRRRFIELLGTATLGGSAAAQTLDSAIDGRFVAALAFPSTASLHAPGHEPLRDESLVPVWAEASATNDDADHDDDAFEYWDDRRIPLVAVDDGVVGVGSTLAHDDAPDGYDNEAFLLNIWDATIGGSGTVLWDHSHDQYWTLDRFGEFETAAERAGYDVRPTWDLTDDLATADAVVIAVPQYDFWDADLDALANFVDDGGTVFLHDRSDYRDYDGTAPLDQITARLDCGFRFNDDQVYDDRHNTGESYDPVTKNFDRDFPFFGQGSGDGDGGGGGGGDGDGDGGTGGGDGGNDDGDDEDGGDGDDGGGDDGGEDTPRTYTADVVSVADGDTVTVRFDGSEKDVRILGVDTPETPPNDGYERLAEWEGIESIDHLGTWGRTASEFATRTLAGETVEVWYDEESNRTDPFGRHLLYVRYDADGDGEQETLYNRELIDRGYARCYDASNARHDAFQAADAAARTAGRGVWSESDPSTTPEIRDDPVARLFVPKPRVVTGATGSLPDARVPVRAESTADPAGAPLVGVDADNRVAMIGGLVIDESYEAAEGFDVDTADYGNFPFLTNLLDSLSSTDGDVTIEGGHGQFDSEAALSAEDAAYYMRYLEGQGIGLDGINDLPNADLSGYRAIVVTTPVTAFSATERKALTSFRDDGGAVALLGSAAASPAGRATLNAIAKHLGSDLRLSSMAVTDRTKNLDRNERLPTTNRYNDSFELFDAYS